MLHCGGSNSPKHGFQSPNLFKQFSFWILVTLGHKWCLQIVVNYSVKTLKGTGRLKNYTSCRCAYFIHGSFSYIPLWGSLSSFFFCVIFKCSAKNITKHFLKCTLYCDFDRSTGEKYMDIHAIVIFLIVKSSCDFIQCTFGMEFTSFQCILGPENQENSRIYVFVWVQILANPFL